MPFCTILTKNLEGYVLNETMGFVIEYLQEFQHVSRKNGMQKKKREWLERY
jgi:hypothetical protein